MNSFSVSIGQVIMVELVFKKEFCSGIEYELQFNYNQLSIEIILNYLFDEAYSFVNIEILSEPYIRHNGNASMPYDRFYLVF